MKKVVIFGVLNWGLGHATRSIPVIRSFIHMGYELIICSDGDALALLQMEFPQLQFVTLPTYRIQYKYRSMLANVSRYGLGLLKTIHQEEKILRDLVQTHTPAYIVSDNRYGFYHPAVQSIIITHQLRIPADSNWQSGAASNFLHRYIHKFNACWVPDVATSPSLSGKLSHDVSLDIPIEYMGALSRFSKHDTTAKYDVAFVLSGPEPQRTYLEKLIVEQLPSLSFKSILVRGTYIPRASNLNIVGHMEVIDLADSETLQQIIAKSKLVFSRAGYTTIMDLVAMRKPAILIPTPGQPEQEYLAAHLASQFSGFKFASQDNLNIAALLDLMPIWGEDLNCAIWSDDKLQSLISKLG